MLKVKSGKQKAQIKAIVYGVEGIGKSTFASQWKNPLFLDFENGTNQLDVDRLNPGSYEEVDVIIDSLIRDTEGYKTLVIDTADWMDKLIQEGICLSKKVDSIEAFGYGKGYTYVSEIWGKFLNKLSRLKMDVVLLAHAEIKKFELPDQTGAFDKYNMKLSRRATPLVKEWADLMLFANYKTVVSKDENEKARARGKKRIMSPLMFI